MPDGLRLHERIYYILWRDVITPVFPYFLDALLRLHIIYHKGRQNYLMGWLTPDKTIEEFISYLGTQGFYNHFVAWVDDGQILSLRRKESWEYQYHLRIFDDGEIRCHYEPTPEAHPVKHFDEINYCKENREDFDEWLNGWVVSQPPASRHLKRPAHIAAYPR